MKRALLLAAAAALSSAWVSPSRAEGATRSLSVWEVRGGRVSVRAWVPLALLARFGATASGAEPPSAEALARAGWLSGDHLLRGLALSVDGTPCTPASGGPLSGTVEDGWLVHTWTLSCPPGRALRLRADAFFEETPSHAHFARLRFGAEQNHGPPRGGVVPGAAEPVRVEEKVFTAADRVWGVGDRSPSAPLRVSLVRVWRAAPLLGVYWLAVVAAGAARRRVARASLAGAIGLGLGGAASFAVDTAASVPVAGFALFVLSLDPFARASETRSASMGVLALVLGAAVAQMLLETHGWNGAIWALLGLGVTAIATWRAPVDGGLLEALVGAVVAASVSRGTALDPSVGRMALWPDVFPWALALAGTGVLATALAWPARGRAGEILAASVVGVALAWTFAGAG